MAIGVGLVGTAGGQDLPTPSEAAVAEAQRLFDEGIASAERGEVDEALSIFNRSYALNPGALNVLYNIGMCRQALGDDVSAANTFREYVLRAGPTMTEAERYEFNGLLASLVPRIGRVAIRIDDPSGTTVSIDGRPVVPALLEGWIAVEPGMHEVSAARGGFVPAAVNVAVAAGELAQARIDLVPVPPAVSASEEDVPEGAAGDAGLGPWFWTAVGIAGASTVALAITGGLALSYRDEFVDGGRLDADLRDSAVTLATASDALLGIAVASAAAATVLLILDLVEEEPEEAGDGPPTVSVDVGVGVANVVVAW